MLDFFFFPFVERRRKKRKKSGDFLCRIIIIIEQKHRRRHRVENEIGHLKYIRRGKSRDGNDVLGETLRGVPDFFPPSEADTARAEAKKRLRMILVADRCTMSDQSMEEMKQKIIDVVEQYVEVDEDVPVDVKVKDDVKFGTVYGITVPVSKVKAEFDAENEAYMIGAQFVYDDETWEELKQETEEEEEEED